MFAPKDCSDFQYEAFDVAEKQYLNSNSPRVVGFSDWEFWMLAEDKIPKKWFVKITKDRSELQCGSFWK